jgi:hypothetical protein
MIFHDVEQNSPEWFKLREGKVTTSNFSKIMANYGKPFGEPAQRYAFRIAKEQVTHERIEEGFTTKAMDDGHIYEPIANRLYEERTFNTVSNGGFCQHEKYDWVGGSPDGLILDQNGGVEYKSVIDWTHRNTIKRNSFDPSYKWQYLGNIWLCGLDWLDFAEYGITYTESKQLFIHRVAREDFVDEIAKIEPRLLEFEELIKEEKQYL